MNTTNQPLKQTPLVSLKDGGISYFDEAANIGVKNLRLRLVLEGEPVVVLLSQQSDSVHVLEGVGNAGEHLSVRTVITRIDSLHAIVVSHTISNTGTLPVRVKEASTGQFGDASAVLHGYGSWLGWDLRYCHTDNVRTEHYPHCQMEYPYFRMLPVDKVRLGGGEDQAFPALFVKDQKGGGGVVFAAASQALNYTTFVLRKGGMVNTSVFDDFAMEHDPRQSDGFIVPGGGSMTLDGLFIQLTRDVAAEDAHVDYINYLAGRFAFRGPKTALLREAFHCTWNYGVFAEQNEAALLPTARFIAKNLPNIKWFLVDAGYLGADLDSTLLDRFYPDPNQYIAPEKWPRGICGFTDELRRLGLRPGIWWSPTAQLNSTLFGEHPDWFLRTLDGSPYRIGEQNGFLDYSHPEALAFLDRTLSVILGKWGMDACKMDFWSQNFESRGVRLSDPSVTAVQARERFFKVIRKHLPQDGIFMTCVATGMGNPFIGQWADTYRNTIDIGVGEWHEQINNCAWALPTLGFEGRKTFLLNNDSVGIMPQYPDNENEFRFTWTFMNMGMIETGGRMETWPEKWVVAMRKLTDRCDRGYRVHCPDERAFTGVPLPEVLFVDFPEDTPTARAGIVQSLAFFNWTDSPRIVSVRRSDLGHTAACHGENFWTGEREAFEGEFITKRLDGRSALLFDIISSI